MGMLRSFYAFCLCIESGKHVIAHSKFLKLPVIYRRGSEKRFQNSIYPRVRWDQSFEVDRESGHFVAKDKVTSSFSEAPLLKCIVLGTARTVERLQEKIIGKKLDYPTMPTQVLTSKKRRKSQRDIQNMRVEPCSSRAPDCWLIQVLEVNNEKNDEQDGASCLLKCQRRNDEMERIEKNMRAMQKELIEETKKTLQQEVEKLNARQFQEFATLLKIQQQEEAESTRISEFESNQLNQAVNEQLDEDANTFNALYSSVSIEEFRQQNTSMEILLTNSVLKRNATESQLPFTKNMSTEEFVCKYTEMDTGCNATDGVPLKDFSRGQLGVVMNAVSCAMEIKDRKENALKE
ncbi:Hypothetical predicted protein [Cloeon dipterum]|uniref:Uncharacterized protein n=2 Tax=Cloeon dipterum TaxID=197152 RepID=A0A8S1DZT7_9INSE|nr:Hypothetical predicted protein [Cloeon dipterum]